jgi:hypothetical protein
VISENVSSAHTHSMFEINYSNVSFEQLKEGFKLISRYLKLGKNLWRELIWLILSLRVSWDLICDMKFAIISNKYFDLWLCYTKSPIWLKY